MDSNKNLKEDSDNGLAQNQPNNIPYLENVISKTMNRLQEQIFQNNYSGKIWVKRSRVREEQL